MFRVLLIIVSGLLIVSPLQAAEHAACREIGHDWSGHTSTEMRQIANSCASDPFADLNYHRAHYLELVFENEAIELLIYHHRSGTSSNLNARIFYMALIEKLAPYYHPAEAQQLEFLNDEYESNNEITETWLRGYANLAKRLDRMEAQYK